MMRALLVHNPFSRKVLKKKEIEIIKDKMSVEYTTDIFETKGIGTIESYIIKNGESYDLIIAVGGDGTIHEAACGILKLEKKPKLAIIPRGTMNDVAKCANMPKSIEKCVKIILKGKIHNHYAYSINDTYFLYGLAIGRYASVSYVADKKKEFGRLAYYFACTKEFFKSKPVDLVINQDKKRVSQVFIFNTKYLAGYRIECESNDKISAYIIPSKNRLYDTIRFWFFLLSKSKRHSKIIEDECIEIIGNDLILTLDGERYKTNNAIIKRANEAIQIITNEH